MNTPTLTPRTDAAWSGAFTASGFSAASAARQMRDKCAELETELAAECERVRVLREALVFIKNCGGMNIETELGEIRCNGSWCAEQARAAIDAAMKP